MYSNLTMESLQLPADLVWNGKMEPLSPPSHQLMPLCGAEGSWLFEDNFGNDILLYDESTTNSDELYQLNESPLPDEIVLGFELECKDEAEQWFDGKPLNPVLDYGLPVTTGQPTLLTKVQYPYGTDMEMEKIYCSPHELTQLTPPQTPPQTSRDLKDIYDIFQQTPQIVSCANYTTNNVQTDVTTDMTPTSTYIEYPVVNSPADEIARETQIVDDILRTRAKDLPDWTDDNDSNYSIESSYICQSHDDDWSPSSPSVSISSSLESPHTGKLSHSTLSKKRTRPYGRAVEERKSRKKEQNKNAATRYRQKKKEEMKVILDEEQILTNRNEELNKYVSDMEGEIKYLKKLIKEFYRNKA